MKHAFGLMVFLMSAGAVASAQTYHCAVNEGGRLLAKGDFVPGKTLVLEAKGARFAIHGVNDMSASLDAATGYHMELSSGKAAALTLASANEPQLLLQLTHLDKNYLVTEAVCVRE